MIHGKTGSVGCLAMGDVAAEELFCLAADTGLKNITVILCPADFRVRELPSDRPEGPSWVAELYGTVEQALSAWRLSATPNACHLG